jgi:hypothetical protein
LRPMASWASSRERNFPLVAWQKLNIVVGELQPPWANL